MTQQNPLQILQAFSPNSANVIGSAQAGQQMVTQGLNQDLLAQQIQQASMQTDALKQQQNINNTVGRLQELERQIGYGATPEQLAQTLQGYISESQARGGNPVDSMQALQALQQGGVEGLANVLGQAKQVFQSQGFIKAPAPAAGMKDAFAKIDPSKFTPESVAAFEQTGQFSQLIPVGEAAQDPEYLKELRAELRKEVTTLSSDANTLKTNFGKLKNLAEEMRGGKNRSAVAQGLVALVKLGDPGSVVREEELKQALGAQNPIAAVSDVLRGSGTDSGVVNSIVQSIDPLNPAAVNVDQILATAEAMLRPNIEAITGAYSTATERGQTQLTEGGFKSIFDTRGQLFSDLSGLTFGANQTPTPTVQKLTSPSGIQFTVE